MSTNTPNYTGCFISEHTLAHSTLREIKLPAKFLEKSEIKKHILLLYDDIEHARKIQLEFIKNGLLKGESCILLVEPSEKITHAKKLMIKYGIDVNQYYSKNKLKLYHTPQLDNDPDGILASFKKFTEKIFSESVPPYRIMGRAIPCISNELNMSIQMTLEKNTNAIFNQLDANIMCYYDINEMPEENQDDVINNLCKHHHVIVDIRNDRKTIRYL